jgi:hypothetical protein
MRRVVCRITNKRLTRAWRTWEAECAETRLLTSWSTKLRRDSHHNTWTWAERCLQAWKQFIMRSKLHSTSTELATEKPLRIKLEHDLSAERTEHIRTAS